VSYVENEIARLRLVALNHEADLIECGENRKKYAP
jgi:hypothetical protein